ncbi:hypothetical protein K438DRAFT_1819756 [Mycena galopus ATCC 62051]|nr:hypothetical protein K438DRAFT_1819756 [Mycena galopus ATCC 62051]
MPALRCHGTIPSRFLPKSTYPRSPTRAPLGLDPPSVSRLSENLCTCHPPPVAQPPSGRRVRSPTPRTNDQGVIYQSSVSRPRAAPRCCPTAPGEACCA